MGMLAVQCRRDDVWAPVLGKLDCGEAARGVVAERTLLQRLDGGCQLPFGVHVQPEHDRWRLVAFLATGPTDPEPVSFALTGADPAALADEAWQRLRAID